MRKLMIALTAAAVTVPAAMPAPAAAQAWRHYNRDWGQVQAYDYDRYEPGYQAYYPDRYYRPVPPM